MACDVDFRARAARGHLAAGPVRRPAGPPRLALAPRGAACLYLGWQLLNLYRLDRWLRLRSQIDPPNLGGIWGDVIGQVVRLHRRKQFHKQRLVQLFRELRRSTAALPDGVIILSSQQRDRLVQPPGRAAARTEAPDRHRPAHRQPDPRARVRPLPARRGFRAAARDPPAGADRPVSGAAAGALRRGPVAAAGARRHPPDAPRGHAQGFRRECLA